MVGKSNDILVEYDYENIILIDPNKLINEEGKAEERLVDHEDMVMYVNLTTKLIPRTRLAIGADIQNSIGEVTLAEINFLSQQTLDGRNFLDNTYTDEITGKNSLKGLGINQPKNVSIKKELNNGKTQDIIIQKTYNEGREGSFNSGLLGITSISIKNSSSFIPSVTIEFEDVRGRALFERGDQSPYAAFFHLPYPIFYLTFKGYYGKAVKYPLQLHTFNARFDSNSGNYKVTCVFYSYKYGVLADLSMGSLYGLPSMYQTQYDITRPNRTTGQGQGTGGSKTETLTTSKGTQKLSEVYSEYKSMGLINSSFPELNMQQLRHRLDVLEDQIKAELGKQDMGALTDADTYAENLKNYRLDVYSVGNQSWFDEFIDQEKYIFDKNKIKIFFLKPEIVKNGNKIELANKTLQTFVDLYTDRLAKNKTFGKGGTFDGKSFEIPNSIRVGTFNYGAIDMTNGIDYQYTYQQRNGRLPNETELTGFTKEVKDYLTDKTTLAQALVGGTKVGYFFDGQKPGTNIVVKKGFLNLISEMLGPTELQKKKEEIEKKMTDKIARILESNSNGLGFRPTIRNISAIIFACAEAFLRLMDEVHVKAWNQRNNSARKSSILENPGNTEQKNALFKAKLLDQSEDAEYPVYPWPQFFVEKKDDNNNTRYDVTYPADESIINKTQAYDYNVWPEVQFEEEFIKSIVDRNKPPLKAYDNPTNRNRISLNAAEFPIANKPYTVRQNTKFVYEMWERFILASYYNGFDDKKLASVLAEMEIQNIDQSGLENDPFLLSFLKNTQFNATNIESVLFDISNKGTGESYQLYSKGFFNTKYINNALDNSFVILGQEYYDQTKTKPDISLEQSYLTTIDNYLKARPTNRKLVDLYPYVVDDWVKLNLSSNPNPQNIYETSKVLAYNTEKKLIANYSSSTQDITTKRPYTNISMYIGEKPNFSTNLGIITLDSKRIEDFYKDRFKDTDTAKGQAMTEGRITYKNYTGEVNFEQTTSMLNTPFFINAIQEGVRKDIFNLTNANNPAYIEAGYLFLNSLPLSTLREKYISTDKKIITDLDYLFSCFKKNSALHKLPYAWVLKYGSIWHRYKKWVQEGKDFLTDVWKDFDYKKNWDFNSTNATSWDLGSTKVTLETNINNNIEIGLGFFPKTINDFNYFYDNTVIFRDYTDQFIKSAFTNNRIILVSGSSTSDKFYTSGYNQTNTAETLNVRTYTFLSNTIFQRKGRYVLPSFGSNINQTYFECFSGNSKDILKTSLVGNNSMYNGSVRLIHSLPNYGYFNTKEVDKPAPNQYLKQVIPTSDRQSAFSFNKSEFYSSIEEIFSVFDTEALDQFEIQFIKWCKSAYDSDYTIPVSNDQFEDAENIDDSQKTNNYVYKNFQNFFKELMYLQESDINLVGKSSSEQILEIQNAQFKNFTNQLTAFLEFDIVIKYGNPTFFDRRVFLSLMNIDGNASGNVIISPINFGFYGDQFSGFVPSPSTANRTLSQLKSQNSVPWKALETYIGFSNIPGISYTNTGSTITDFFPTMGVSFNANNIQILAPLIKIFATKKKLNPNYNKTLFLNDLNTYVNEMKSLRNTSFNIFMDNLSKKLGNISQPKFLRAQGAPLTGNQTRVELWEMFKSLNDKWVAGNNYTSRTLFEDALFLDRASRDIGDKVFIDIYKLKSMMTDVNMDGRVMGFLMDFIMENNFVIMSVPSYVNFYNVQDVNNDTTPKIEGSAEFANTMFGTHMTVDIRNSSPKLVCFYVDKVSEHPDIENTEYRWGSDSFDLRRFSDNPLLENQIGKNDWGRSNKVVGFHVDVGIQNQNMFSNVILAQDPGKSTAESVTILDSMANSASGKQTATQNVSLFNLYKTRSYTCQVQCMGNAMIQPTMYFNLRHVPMFNGPYMILSVEHSIQPGSFVTTFSGVRQSKYSFPLITDFIQNIYKVYLSKFLENVRNDVNTKEKSRRNVTTINTEKISNTSEKNTTENDCRPENSTNATKYTLTSDSDFITEKTFSNNQIRDMVSSITDVRLRLLVFSAIYVSSFKDDSYYASANNLIGFSLDNTIKGSLGNYLVDKYVCAQVRDKKIPLAIFKSTSNMVSFASDWFKNYTSGMTGKIELLPKQTLFIYTKYWQKTLDDKNVNNYIGSVEGQLDLRKFEEANLKYLSLFPLDSGKSF